MVELDRANDEMAGPIVKKLRSTVEEGGVVLVSLDDKERTATEAESSGVPARKAVSTASRLG